MNLNKKHQRGFNLIEAAIVLSVVGLVIGGIWVAAAAVYERHKWQQTEAGWLLYINYISKNYPRQLMGTMPSNQDLETTLLSTVGLPAGWSRGGEYGIHPVDPYGNALYVQLQPGTFYMGYNAQTPSKDFCINWMLMTYNKILGADKLLNAYYTNFTGTPGTCDPAGGSYNPATGVKTNVSYVATNCCPAGGIGFYVYYPN